MTTTNLTPAQHATLAHAVEHTCGKIDWFPDNIKGGARKKVLQSLAAHRLVATEDETWFVTDAGYEALGAAQCKPAQSDGSDASALPTAATQAPHAAPEFGIAPGVLEPQLEADVAACEATWAQDVKATQVKPHTRAHSKQAMVIAMLSRPEGATVAQIIEATGWQAHTIRGTFAGAFKKKLGMTITSDKPQGGVRTYRILV